ncbi:hypothetical protein [Bacillus sp. Hm123]
MFNTNSVVAQVWAKVVRKGDKKITEVPDLHNLRTIVSKILEGGE